MEYFELNHYLGQLMMLAIISKAVFIALTIPVYQSYLAKTEPR